MYKLKIICVGKLKEQYLLDMENEYLKRLSKYCSVNIVEVKDGKIPDHSSLKEDESVKDKEFAGILKNISLSDYVILLDLNGNEYDSLELSSHLHGVFDNKTNITFIIGGSLGFSKEIEKYAKEKIKLSRLTFTHQMTRIILLEQIYRSFKIINNETYHK
jgi:23S rRNA (pseudouridine1915-N3)-methyltransferase